MKTSTPQTPRPRTPAKILIIGREGTRKTGLALTFPGPYVFDCDQNLNGPEMAVRKIIPNLEFWYDEIRKNDSGEPINTDDCYDRIIMKVADLKASPAYKEGKIKWAVLDSMSHVNEFCIRHTLKLQGKQKKVGEMETRDWNPFASYSYNLIVGKLEELKVGVICLCHEYPIYSAPDPQKPFEKVITGCEPAYQGKFGDNVGAFFTDCWRLELVPVAGGKYKWELQTNKTGMCKILKNSFGMPDVIELKTGYADIKQYLEPAVTK